MSRNLDMTALRSFVAVAEAGGVTRAAGRLNLTQSAVSMQLKRLEESLGVSLLSRSTRRVAPTAAGDKLLSYARSMLRLNDEAVAQMNISADAGEIVLGIPVDILDPVIPQVLRRFRSEFPMIRVQMLTENTMSLKQAFAHGDCHMTLATEQGCDSNGRTIAELPMVWVGAADGHAWQSETIPLAVGRQCLFRPYAVKELDKMNIPWEIVLEAAGHRAIEAAVAADLAIHVLLKGTNPPRFEVVDHKGELPQLGTWQINLYRERNQWSAPLDRLEELLAEGFAEIQTSGV